MHIRREEIPVPGATGPAEPEPEEDQEPLGARDLLLSLSATGVRG